MTKDIMIAAVRKWICPFGCDKVTFTNEHKPRQRFHICPTNGLATPFIEEGVKVRVVPVEREDYVGKEHAQLSNKGRPVMAMKTEHADGRVDTAVLAPHARIEVNN